jgi:hypothetical protein
MKKAGVARMHLKPRPAIPSIRENAFLRLQEKASATGRHAGSSLQAALRPFVVVVVVVVGSRGLALGPAKLDE